MTCVDGEETSVEEEETGVERIRDTCGGERDRC
jgi:hypothetical protein